MYRLTFQGLILLTRGFIFASVYTISWSPIPGKGPTLLTSVGLLVKYSLDYDMENTKGLSHGKENAKNMWF